MKGTIVGTERTAEGTRYTIRLDSGEIKAGLSADELRLAIGEEAVRAREAEIARRHIDADLKILTLTEHFFAAKESKEHEELAALREFNKTLGVFAEHLERLAGLERGAEGFQKEAAEVIRSAAEHLESGAEKARVAAEAANAEARADVSRAVAALRTDLVASLGGVAEIGAALRADLTTSLGEVAAMGAAVGSAQVTALGRVQSSEIALSSALDRLASAQEKSAAALEAQTAAIAKAREAASQDARSIVASVERLSAAKRRATGKPIRDDAGKIVGVEAEVEIIQ